MDEKQQDDIAERLVKIEVTLDDIKKILIGNGKPGLVDDFNRLQQQHQIVYDRQNRCQASQKERKIDFKWVAVLIISVAAILQKYI